MLTRIGPYKILQLIGEGGMGEVYMAEQRKPVRRNVALKIIKLGMDTKQVVARFEAERQALAVMDHPNIAKVFDAGTTKSGRAYFVMELVSGVDLTTYCDTHKLPMRERLRLFIGICEAIQHAHQKGVIHRDLKPTNVLVTIPNGSPIPKVIDFGLAKAIGHRLTERTLVTEQGQPMGTALYMSPEQAEMSGLDVDTRTDVYSLGVMLYELLVGALPFDPTEFPWDAAVVQLVLRDTDPPKPSARFSGLGDSQPTIARLRHTNPAALRAQLRDDLDWIIMRAMDKDRTRRYETVSGLALDVQRHLNNEPVLAGPPSATYRLGKFVRRHKAGVGAGFVVAAGLVVGSALAMAGMIRATRAERVAQTEAETSQQVSDFLVELFEVSDPSEARGNTITAREILDQGAEKITTELTDQPLTQAQLMNTIGRVYTSLGLYGQAAPMLQAALTLRNAHADDHPDVAESLNDLAYLFARQGKFAEAEPLYQRALTIREQALGPDHPDVGRSLNNLAVLHDTRGEYAEAEPLFERALAIREKALGPDHPDVAESLRGLADQYSTQGKYAEAEPLLERALAIEEKALGPDHPEVAESLTYLAILYWSQSKAAEAEHLFERALAIKEKALGPDHPDVAGGLNNLAIVYQTQDKYAEAEPLYERSLAIKEKALGPDHPTVSSGLGNLADLYVKQGRYAEAEPLYQRSLAIREKALGPDHVNVSAGLSSLAVLYVKQERYAEAEPLFERALAIDEKALGPDHHIVASLLEDYAGLLRQTGRASAADSLAARATAIRDRQKSERDR